MSWIKLDHTTQDKPEVFLIADGLGIDPDAVLGKLVRVWVWADQQTTDGNAPSVTSSLLDRITGVTGFATALESVGWLTRTDDGLTFPNFARHNGQTSKARALTAQRVAKSRSGSKSKCNAPTVTEALPEKRREEETVVVVGGSDQHNGKDPAWLVKLRALANHTPLSRDLVERIGVSVALKLTPAQAAIGLVPTFDPRKGKVKDATAYLSKVCRSFEEKYDGDIFTRSI